MVSLRLSRGRVVIIFKCGLLGLVGEDRKATCGFVSFRGYNVLAMDKGDSRDI